MLVRGIPRGSLEQVIFRVDACTCSAARGVRAVNGAPAIERTVDKFLASALLAARRHPDAAHDRLRAGRRRAVAFEELGGDVIVKPLFGSMGLGMARVEDPDVAERVFRALELERAVYYLQEMRSGRDVRAFVVGERVVGAISRVSDGWRANVARGLR